MMEFFNWLNALFSYNATIFLIATSILSSLCFGVLVSSSEEFGFPSVLNPLLLFSLFLLTLVFFLFGCDLGSTFFSGYYFSQSFQMLFLFLSIMVLLTTRDFTNARKITKFEYDILLSFVVLSALCLCFADDFLLVYLAIELQSLCLYVFATFNRNSEFSTESGLKYFIFGAIISCLLLLGFSLIYLSFGSTSFEFLMNLTQSSSDSFLFIGILFILIAFLFKVGSAPFHSWLCDVYDGAITSVTLLFASMPKIIIFSVILKLFLLVFFEFKDFWSPLFLFASVLSVAVGSISALYQKRIKRLFAYSTIAHTGFLLLGVVAASPHSANSLIFYIVIYSLLTILLFSVLIFAIISQKNFPAYIANWTSCSLRNYIFIITFTLVLFSIAGIPPLAGFFSKLGVLTSIIINEYYVTALVIVIISSIASFYYIRLIKTFFFVKTRKNNLWISNSKRPIMEFNIGVLLFFNVAFWFHPELLSLMSTVIGLTLF